MAIEGQRDYKNGIYIFDESVFYFIPFLFHLFHYLWNAFSEMGGGAIEMSYHTHKIKHKQETVQDKNKN